MNTIVTNFGTNEKTGIKINKKITKDFYDAILEFADQPHKREPLTMSPLDEEIYE
ncbi:MAG: hypothetical protein AAB768_04045 [Patescibacteria group bacterium]